MIDGDRLLVAADAGLGEFQDSKRQPCSRGVALIHAEQIGGEQRRLVAAGAGADLQDGVASRRPRPWAAACASRRARARAGASAAPPPLPRPWPCMSGSAAIGLRPSSASSRSAAARIRRSASTSGSELGIFLRGGDELLRIERCRRTAPPAARHAARGRSGRASASSDTVRASAPSAQPASERIERHFALLAAVEILQLRHAPRQLVVAEDTAARALSLLARCMRRFMLPR